MLTLIHVITQLDMYKLEAVLYIVLKGKGILCASILNLFQVFTSKIAHKISEVTFSLNLN